MTAASPDVRLILPARPENVALVRQALSGLADAEEIDAGLVGDMKIAVTEACTNVVVHAYGDDVGSLEVVMTLVGQHLTITVADFGPGLEATPVSPDDGPLGFGLALMTALADAFSIEGGTEGTTVRMTFALTAEQAEPVRVDPTGGLRADGSAPEAIEVSLPPGRFLSAVLSRVVSLLAARADFSIDRLSDAQLVSDALASHVPRHTVDGRVTVHVREAERSFELLIGPLVKGGGERLVRDTELPGLGPLLEQLSTELEVESVNAEREGVSGEALRLALGPSKDV